MSLGVVKYLRHLLVVFLCGVFSSHGFTLGLCDESGELGSVNYLVPIQRSGQVSEFYRSIKASDFDSFPGLSGQEGRREVKTVFFDDADYNLLRGGTEIWLYEQQAMPEFRDDKRQVFVGLTSEDHFNIRKFDYRSYNNKKYSLDSHPLLGHVKRRERQVFLDLLQVPPEVDARDLKPRLTVLHDELVYALFLYGKPVGEIVVDAFHIENFGLSNTQFSLKVSTVDAGYSGLTSEEKSLLTSSMCKLVKEFESTFPRLQASEYIGGAVFLNLAEKSFPGRVFFEKHVILYKLCQALVLVGMGWLLLSLIMGRYKPNKRLSVRVRQRVER